MSPRGPRAALASAQQTKGGVIPPPIPPPAALAQALDIRLVGGHRRRLQLLAKALARALRTRGCSVEVSAGCPRGARAQPQPAARSARAGARCLLPPTCARAPSSASATHSALAAHSHA